MTANHEALIEKLQPHVQPVLAQDAMSEAGRKALLNDFIKMLQNEAGSRAGEDTVGVHDMRVATRRMRSTLRLLSNHYKPKVIDPYLNDMSTVAEALGEVRDLDVMLDEISRFAETLGEHNDLQPILDQLEAKRTKARKALVRALDKRSYRRFVEDYAAFLSKPGKGVLPVDPDEIRPFQVRHLLPELIYEHLGAVRAYDDVIEEADDLTLHALRIEFKRLRYAIAIFADVLGKSAAEFLNELKVVQDHLGKLNDLHIAQDQLNNIARGLDQQTQAETISALEQYSAHLNEEQQTLRAGVNQVWAHFNSKTVQRQLSNAVAAL
ncbi:MAG: CHAD domain-containing protein [Chloroflexota bacterium]